MLFNDDIHSHLTIFLVCVLQCVIQHPIYSATSPSACWLRQGWLVMYITLTIFFFNSKDYVMLIMVYYSLNYKFVYFDFWWLWINIDNFGWLWINIDDFGWLWKNIDGLWWLWINIDDFLWLWINKLCFLIVMDKHWWCASVVVCGISLHSWKYRSGPNLWSTALSDLHWCLPACHRICGGATCLPSQSALWFLLPFH